MIAVTSVLTVLRMTQRRSQRCAHAGKMSWDCLLHRDRPDVFLSSLLTDPLNRAVVLFGKFI